MKGVSKEFASASFERRKLVLLKKGSTRVLFVLAVDTKNCFFELCTIGREYW